MNPLINKLKPVLYVFVSFGILNLFAHFAETLLAFPLRSGKYGFLIFGIGFPYLALHIYGRRAVDDLQLLSKACTVILSIGLLMLIIDLFGFVLLGRGIANRVTVWAISVFDVVVAAMILRGFVIIHRHKKNSNDPTAN